MYYHQRKRFMMSLTSIHRLHCQVYRHLCHPLQRRDPMILSFPLRRLLLNPSHLPGVAHLVYQSVAEMCHLMIMRLRHLHKSGRAKVVALNPVRRQQHIDGAAGKALRQKTDSSSHLTLVVLAPNRNSVRRIGSKDSQGMTLIALWILVLTVRS